jgi:hypothetical protein
MVPKQMGKPSAKEMLPKKTKPSMADMAKNRPASKNDMKNKKKSGSKSWNNGYTN